MLSDNVMFMDNVSSLQSKLLKKNNLHTKGL